MKIFVFLIFATFFFGCGDIKYPDGFVESVLFTGDIIDVQKKQISSKEELIKYIDEATTRRRLSVFANYGDKYRNRQDSFRLVVYINPLQDNEPVLSATKYKFGMPIVVSPPWWWDSGFENRYMLPSFFSEQPVILVKGNPEYWAESSFKCGDRTFTILPISNGLENAELRFTYTIAEANGRL
ncbi:MAG: hypothetical protein FWE23_00255 [Chitinivibrionia bacterium]|nr:hypothetical protein [Chitinivibrionia bacterium]